jgi:DNA-binding response OmpR family regulator
MTETSNKVRNLLVLEDEPLIAMMLQDELESLGLHVIGPVSNLKSALLLAETSNLDGALLDRNINGTLADAVADKLHSRKISYIFVSGYDYPTGLRHRDVPVLQKPFNKIELRMALLSLLERTNS